MKQFRGGLAFKAHRLLYHSILRLRGIKEKRRQARNLALGEAGSCLRRIDTCVTQLKAQGLARTCNESKEEEKKKIRRVRNLTLGERLRLFVFEAHRLVYHST